VLFNKGSEKWGEDVIVAIKTPDKFVLTTQQQTKVRDSFQ